MNASRVLKFLKVFKVCTAALFIGDDVNGIQDEGCSLDRATNCLLFIVKKKLIISVCLVISVLLLWSHTHIRQETLSQ